MPLPDERPRQSVANLIGRFETQSKKQPTSTPGSSRNSSVASNISSTGDTAKEQAKERMEWPPRSVGSNERPPPIIPSSSWTRKQSLDNATGINHSEAKPEPLRPTSSVDNKDEDTVATPRPASVNSIPEVAKVETPAQKPLTVNVTAPKQPTGSGDTPETARLPAKTPSAAKATSQSTVKTTTKVTPKSTPTKPAATATQAQPPMAPSLSRKPAVKTPITPARAQTPSRTQSSVSRPKTPSSTTRSKTPSSGLYAPTAASLARSRNAPQPPLPVKKITVSSSAAERLSKPTAASLLKMRQAPVVTSPPKATNKAPARTVAGKSVIKSDPPPVVKGKLEPNPPKAEELKVPAESVEVAAGPAASPEPAVPAEEVIITPEASPEPSNAEEQPVVAEPEGAPEQKPVEAVKPEAKSESPPSELLSKHEAEVNGNYHEDGESAKAAHLTANGLGDDIEQMVNLLEAVNAKPRPTSIISMPDEVAEIPDEDH